MPASFTVGLSKVESGKAPRLIVVSGDEPELIKKVKDAFFRVADSNNIYSFPDFDIATKRLIFVQGHRAGRGTSICIDSTRGCNEWEWLASWFNQVKRTQVLIHTDATTASRIEKIANTRGIHIRCDSPKSDRQLSTITRYFAEQYGQSPTQVRLLFDKNNWQLSPCLQLLDKLSLLKLPLSSDTMLRLGVVHDPVYAFVQALTTDNTATAMTVIPKINVNEYVNVLTQLSEWIDKLVRLKSTQAFMKSDSQLAFETGIDSKEIAGLLRLARRFEYPRINQISLALANAFSDISAGNTHGVLEILASRW